MVKDCTPPPKRQAVLIVADGDYLEIFADKSVDVHVARMPQGETRRGERIADTVMEMALPLRFRDLYDRSLLRANAIVRPLLAETALQARKVKRAVGALNRLKDEPREQVA